MEEFGRHLLVEFFGCDSQILNDREKIEAVMSAAVVASGATEVQKVFHRFEPVGVTGVIVLSESHLSIHTWPETGYAAVDFYTCGDCNPHAGADVLFEGLKAGSFEKLFVERGIRPFTPSMRIVEHKLAEPKLVETGS